MINCGKQEQNTPETASLLSDQNDDQNYMSINRVDSSNNVNNSFSQHFSDQLQQTSFLFNRNITVTNDRVKSNVYFTFLIIILKLFILE